ncbi:MAG: polysaccharide biosynthesis protein [Proteobacteria bacterium]|nr:NAD-dependent epimerase/dehydratase family protein [Desulfobulbaceae bacterium]MBU4153475.1 polysaccharide biosynthesis protein [Pseudomonadota bacterium]
MLNGKRILITGCSGTVGTELVHQLLSGLKYQISEMIGLDNNESELFFQDQHHLNDARARFFVADVRDKDELTCKMAGIDIVFHAAALKHVVLSERSPEQAVQTNIIGVQNVIAAAQANGVERVIFTSSDKAVNPTNVMGTSKLMGERLMTAANSNKRGNGPIFASTRFGNVLGSSGSVIPIFHNQIAKGGPVTLTHRDMTRFVMSIQESVRLVIDSAMLARGGEVFITKMPVVRIVDLAKAMINELAPVYGKRPEEIEITEIGTKPGEKLYEELMSPEETRRAIELKQYFSVMPAFRGIYHDIDYDYPGIIGSQVTNPYVSADETSLNVDQIRQLLKNYNLLNVPGDTLGSRYWPGDKEEKD